MYDLIQKYLTRSFWKVTGWPLRLYAIVSTVVILTFPLEYYVPVFLVVGFIGSLFHTGEPGPATWSARAVIQVETWGYRYFFLFIVILLLRMEYYVWTLFIILVEGALLPSEPGPGAWVPRYVPKGESRKPKPSGTWTARYISQGEAWAYFISVGFVVVFVLRKIVMTYLG